MTVKIGSCFAGIGGWELGLERAIPNSRTIWQVEQNTYCQGILKKHWPDATIYDDVRTVGAHNLESIDLLCAGFPCQDLSLAGNKRGIHEGKKSSLYWELYRIISEIRPRIICLENVANIIRLGGADVIASLAEIGYDCEWTVIRSGSDFGAPHHRARWFCVAYSESVRLQKSKTQSGGFYMQGSRLRPISAQRGYANGSESRGNYWKKFPIESAICGRNDGVPNRLDRIKALGNAIVPQASEWVGCQIVQSGLIDDLID